MAQPSGGSRRRRADGNQDSRGRLIRTRRDRGKTGPPPALIEIKAGAGQAAMLLQSEARRSMMPVDVQISFRGLDTSPAIEAQVRQRAEELGKLSSRLSACKVVLEALQRRQRHGRIYQVRVDLTVPGGPIVINRAPHEDHAHEDIYVSIRDAFDAARRRLQDHMQQLDGQTKAHAEPQGD